jgi:enediyne biosynthesis protein E4
VTSVEITWPGGRVETVPDVSANQAITIQEGKGIIASQPIVFARP